MAGETVLTIVGNLTADPELRTTGGGATVASFTIASTPRNWNRQANQFEDGQEYQLVYSGFWRMVDDCLQLNVSTGVGNSPSDASGIFPVLLDPSGDYLLIWQDRDNGMCPPFFEDGMSSAELIRSYG